MSRYILLVVVVVLVSGPLISLLIPDPVSAQEVVVTDPISPYLSKDIIRSAQNIEVNRYGSLDEVFYLVSLMDITGGQMDLLERQHLINLTRSFQNKDGGFGDWYRDRSKAGSTLMALQTLSILRSEPLNRTGTVDFLRRLQVTGLAYGNFGFRSSLQESDADVSSTHDVVMAFGLLDIPVPNASEVIFYLNDHQNIDGGFGYQTNRGSGIIWPSTMVYSHRGIFALDAMGEAPELRDAAKEFIQGLQDEVGGFSNGPNELSRVSFTYDAVTSLMALGEPIPRRSEVIDFVRGNHMGNGGYIEYALDTEEGLHTTYFAVLTLKALGESFDASSVESFVRMKFEERMDGGFGEEPGFSSNSRTTFDAVSALNRIGHRPIDRQAAARHMTILRNNDGGYGANNLSNIETTYRAVLSLQMLGEPLEEPAMTIDYVRGLQNNDGGFGFAEGYISRGAYTYRAIRTLGVLGSSPYNIDGAVRFLKDLQNIDGGFGNFKGEEDSDLTSTYRAIRSLKILGAEPLYIDNAEDFVLGSMNPDGGFKRSPSDITAPMNYSTSLNTYNAVLALYFLGKPLQDKALTYSFLRLLRNPDLGFGPNPFFTSTVTDTFTALWAIFYLSGNAIDMPPSLINQSFSPKDPHSTTLIEFTVEWSDPEGQFPEYVHLEVDGSKYLMSPITPKNHLYTAKIMLPQGNHSFYISASDGLNLVRSTPSHIDIHQATISRSVRVIIDPVEGMEDTKFSFLVDYDSPEIIDPVYVQVQLDSGEWKNVTMDSSDHYSIEATLKPGVHLTRARAFTGDDFVYSDKMYGPVVHSLSPSRPDWPTYLKIKDLINRTYGQTVDFDNVTRETKDGKLVWRVALDGRQVFVTYDGERIFDERDNEETDLLSFLALAVVLIFVLSIVTLGLYMVYRKKG